MKTVPYFINLPNKINIQMKLNYVYKGKIHNHRVFIYNTMNKANRNRNNKIERMWYS